MGNIIKKDIVALEKGNMLDYFLSIIYDRAVADVNDGLKPVQRRILFTANDMNWNHSKPHIKSARLVGDVMGKYHPHGDASIYDASMRMCQNWSYNIPLMDGHGNIGSIQGDSPAAMRYTEIRLAKMAEDLILSDIEKNAVDYIPNYDSTEKEAQLLPVKFPALLVNGGFGIAGGFMQSIPTHNIKDVAEIVIKLIKNPNLTVQDIASELVPDYPTGGLLCSKKAIEQAYITGRGNVKLRASVKHVVPKNSKKTYLSIYETCFMLDTSNLINSIVEAVKEGKVEGVSDIQDLSSSKELDIRVYLKSDADPDVVLNQLYKFTNMETTQKIILVGKNLNELKVYNIKDLFTEWIIFRKETIRRIVSFEISKLKHRDHIIDGLVIALGDIDNVIKIIKTSKNTEEAKAKLKSKYSLTDIQTKAIVDMRLSQLTNLEINKLKDEKDSIVKEIEEKIKSLSSEEIDKRIIAEQKEIIKKYGIERKTRIEEIQTDISTEDIIPDENALVVITQGNYIKRVMNDFKEQKRGGKGINIGENNITELFSTTTKDHLLCFTNLGRVFDIKVWEIKEGQLKSKGTKIESYLKLKDNEFVSNILCISNNQMNDTDSYLVFLTKNGLIKKTKLELFNNIRSTGIIAIMLRNDDELNSVKYIDCSKEMQDILLVTEKGLAIRFEHSEIEERGRDTMGVKGIDLAEDDFVSDMILVENNDQLIFFATKNGLGKLVKVHDMVEKKDPNTKQLVNIDDGFPRQRRSSSSKGRIGIKLKEDDKLVSIIACDSENEQLMIVSNNKMMVITSGEFRKPVKRPTFGVKIITLENEDFVNKVIKY